MESRYLYRGKRIDNREWVEGFLFMVNDVPYILPHHKTGQPIHADNLLKQLSKCWKIRSASAPDLRIRKAS